MFVSVSNPDGIQHHGGQMAWDAVSDDRVVMMTYTKDNKALIQEINNVGGAPVIGPASYIATSDGLFPAGASYAHHHRPKICAVKGTDKVIALIPNTFARITAVSTAGLAGISIAAVYLGRASGDITADQPYVAMPLNYTAYLLQRDTGGLYKILDSMPLTVPAYTGYSWNARSAVTADFSSATQVNVRYYYVADVRTVGGLRVAQHTLTISADGKLSLTTGSLNLFTSSVSNMYYAFGAKKTRDRKGVYSDMLMFANLDSMSGAAQNYWLSQTPTIRPGPQNGSAAVFSGSLLGDTNNRATLGSHVPVDKAVDGSYYATGYTLAGSNTLYKNAAFNYLGNTKAVYYPLDTGFVTQDIVCVVGGTANGNGNTAQNDVDLAYSIASKNKGDVAQLQLSFRMITGSGHFAGPYDPLMLPYWHASITNNSEILHKVSDANFWLIGCWMQSQSADPQIGVISVKPPAA